MVDLGKKFDFGVILKTYWVKIADSSSMLVSIRIHVFSGLSKYKCLKTWKVCIKILLLVYLIWFCLQCFDAVGWAA